ncbi:hypothetical protein WS52_17325 [Burkholderia territorii]|nr:hypothetical protein WS52_17325 [Burkholderia territorii]
MNRIRATGRGDAQKAGSARRTGLASADIRTHRTARCATHTGFVICARQRSITAIGILRALEVD